MSTTRQIPLRYQTREEAYVKKLTDLGKITKVAQPNPWCCHAFFVPKPDDMIELVTDFLLINMIINRDQTIDKKKDDTIQPIPNIATCFATLDLAEGQFQIPLDEESSFVTTFLLPLGRYRHLSLPHRRTPPHKEWNKVKQSIASNCRLTNTSADTILIHAPDYPILKNRLEKIVTRCQNINLSITKNNLQVGDTVHFPGNKISKDGVTPDKNNIRAKRGFQRPSNRSDIRGFIRLAK